jgi:hypothetical protein
MSSVLIARANLIESTDEDAWKEAAAASIAHMPARLAFMTPAHHRIRNFAVRELPRNGGRPLAIADIAAATGTPEAATRAIVAELERQLFFVVREGEDHVSWAYPVTVDRTPHRLMFGTGESVFGA